MKTYLEFINESRIERGGIINDTVPINFKFAIDTRYSTEDELNAVIAEFEKYAEISNLNKRYLMKGSYGDRLPWAWHFEFHISFDHIHINLEVGIITTTNWGAGVKFMENIITVREFLNVGVKGVKEYIETKSDMEKFNL